MGLVLPKNYIAIPSIWVGGRYEPLPKSFMNTHTHIKKACPDIYDIIHDIAKKTDSSAWFFVQRAEFEQGAFTYKWDGSTSHYGGGRKGEVEKLRWFCGVDKTDAGPRVDGWEGVANQLMGAISRFLWWYNGNMYRMEGAPPIPKALLTISTNIAMGYVAGAKLPPNKDNYVIPGNHATASALRYTPHVNTLKRLGDIGRLLDPLAFEREEKLVITNPDLNDLPPRPIDDKENQQEGIFVIAKPKMEPRGFVLPSGLSKRTKTTHIAVHHTGAEFGSVSGIDSWHRQQGWACFGYHAYIDKKGKIHPGRPFDVIGSQVGGHNSYSIGVSLEGNFDKEVPNTQQILALQDLLTWLCEEFAVDSANIKGHKDFSGHGSNSCPGKNLYKLLPEMRTTIHNRLVSARQGSSGTVTPIQPVTTISEPSKPKSGTIVVLDLGHGGATDSSHTTLDTGAVVQLGNGEVVREVDLIDEIGLNVRELLEQDSAIGVAFTRPPGMNKSVYMQVVDRAKFTVNIKPKVAISINFAQDKKDKSSKGGCTGIYYSEGAPKGKKLAGFLTSSLVEHIKHGFFYGTKEQLVSNNPYDRNYFTTDNNWAVTDAVAILYVARLDSQADLNVIASMGAEKFCLEVAKSICRAIYMYFGILDNAPESWKPLVSEEPYEPILSCSNCFMEDIEPELPIEWTDEEKDASIKPVDRSLFQIIMDAIMSILTGLGKRDGI